MGSSLSNIEIIEELKVKYGKEFMKVIIAEKTIETIRTNFNEINNQLDSSFHDGKISTTNIVADKINYVTMQFKSLKEKIETTLPGGIAVIEKKQGKSIEQIVGLNLLISKVNEVQSKALNQMNDKQVSIRQQFKSKQQSLIQSVNQQKPSIPIYDQLPEIVQKQILLKAQQMFYEQIKQRQAQVMKQMSGEINIDTIKNIVSQLVPNKQLNSVVEKAQNNVNNMFTTLLGVTGLSLQGNLGGIVNIISNLLGTTNNNTNINTNSNMKISNIATITNNTKKQKPSNTETKIDQTTQEQQQKYEMMSNPFI